MAGYTPRQGLRYKVVDGMRVFVYCRVAHDDSFSLEAQAAQLRRYAEQAGYTIIGATAEQGNGLALDRPGLEMVTQAVLAGKVDMVLVNSIDRIGREWGMTQAYIDLLTQHAQFASTDCPFRMNGAGSSVEAV